VFARTQNILNPSIPITVMLMPTKLEKGKKVTISLDEVIVRSDGSKATMREFVKEMLHYNPEFLIEMSPKGETWYLKRKTNK